MKLFYFCVVVLMFFLACSKVEVQDKKIKNEYIVPLDPSDRTYIDSV